MADKQMTVSREAEFEDKYGLLQGVGKVSKHVKLKDVKSIDEAVLQYYIGQAVTLDLWRKGQVFIVFIYIGGGFMIGWALVIIGLSVWALSLYLNYRHQNKIISFLSNGEPKKFLHEIEAPIEKVKSMKFKNILYVNKAAGLFHDGQFEAAYNLLKSIDPNFFPTNFQLLYWNNLICTMFLLGKMKEAEAIINEKQDFFLPNSRNNRLNQAIRNTLATYHYYMGDMETSKSVFMQMATEKLSKVSSADVNYFLGLIASKEGDISAAKGYFEIALEKCGETYLRKNINEALTGIAKQGDV